MHHLIKFFSLFLFGMFVSTATPNLVMAVSQESKVASEIAAFAANLAARPSAVIDLSKVSGEYCMKVDIGDNGMMIHYAADPTKTKEDVITFVKAAALVEAGLDVTKLEPHSGKLNTMEPNKWYYVKKGTFEPHHGIKFPFDVLVKSVNMDN